MTYRRLLDLQRMSRARDVFEVKPSEFDLILGMAVAYVKGTMQDTSAELQLGPYDERDIPQSRDAAGLQGSGWPH